jgi:hypothetical protein
MLQKLYCVLQKIFLKPLLVKGFSVLCKEILKES